MKFRTILMKFKSKILDETAASVFFALAISVVIVFVIGGILLNGLSGAFSLEIVPSIINKIKEIVAW